MGGRIWGRANITQLLTEMFLKSPPDSVPSLNALQLLASVQLVIAHKIDRSWLPQTALKRTDS